MSTSSQKVREKPALKRTINKTRGISLIIGSVLGSGLLILPGLAYSEIGAISFFSWIAMGFFIIPFLYIFVKLIVLFPSAGGLVSIVNDILGSKISHSISYLILFSMIILVPIVAIIGSNYIGYLFNLSNTFIILMAAVMLILSTILNSFNTNIILKIQGISTTFLLFLLFLVIGISSNLAMPSFLSQISAINFFHINTYHFMGMGMILVFWAFLGWENLSFTSEEFSNLKQDFPKAVIFSFLIMMFLYLGLSISVIGTLSPSSYVTAQAPLAEVVSVSLGSNYGKFTALIGTLIMVINLNAWVWGPSRLLYDCGRKKILPSFFNQLNKYHSPANSLFTLLALYLIILSLMLFSEIVLIDTLIKLVNAGFMILYLLTIICFQKISNNLTDKILGGFALVVTIITTTFFGLYILFPLAFLLLGMSQSFFNNNKS